MSVNGERFGEKVGKVKEGRDIREIKEALTDSITEPVKSHIHRLRFLGRTVAWVRPMVHSLSQNIGEGGWG